MASINQTQRHWYNDKELFLHGLARSNYVTAITDWFMGFAGKWAELVLYATVLYSCAELYPGVHLPDGLSLAVFLVQLGALDIGGLSLAKLAKQAREDGNAAGAKNAELLSKMLISIMLCGVVVVGLEHALPFPLPSWVITSIDVLLVVARSICSVLYGKVVHSLKREAVRMLPETEVAAKINEHLQVLQGHTDRRIAESERRISDQFLHLLQSVEQMEATNQRGNVTDTLQSILAAVQEHTHALEQLATLPARLGELEQSVSSVANGATPHLSVVGNRHRPTNSGKVDKGAFVRRCLASDPTMRTSDIQRLAKDQGITIAHSYISDIRKAATSEQSA